MSLAIHDDGPMKSLEPPDSHHLIAADGWLGLGNWQEALLEIERIIPELRLHPDVQEVRWQIQATAKNWEEAICVAREITQRTPELPFGWIHLAYSLHELRRTQEAYGTLKPISERFPEEWLMGYNMACYACQLGNQDEARDWLELAYKRGDKSEIRKMARLDPDLAPLRARFGEI